jgi:CheY-like chemotaxis protein
LFRQQFRRDLRTDRFTMEFAQSAPMALQRITDAGNRSLILILSDINMPGMCGLELLPKARAARPDVPIIMITACGDAETKRKALEGGCGKRLGDEQLGGRRHLLWQASRGALYALRRPRRCSFLRHGQAGASAADRTSATTVGT